MLAILLLPSLVVTLAMVIHAFLFLVMRHAFPLLAFDNWRSDLCTCFKQSRQSLISGQWPGLNSWRGSPTV
jgi:hypothetical protein